ncbi:MAG: adenosylcobinamide-GDP ribazoletransferase [Candidatus Hydrothermarchaeota archaeon]
MLNGIRGLFSFFTVMPFKKCEISEIIKFLYLLPFVGFSLGCFSYWIANFIGILDMKLGLTAGLFSLYFLTGFLHLDGLIDVGDAWMIKDREKRVEIMKDSNIGVGGFGIAIFTILITFFSLLELGYVGLILSETYAKLGMISCMYFGNPLWNGLGKHFVEGIDSKQFLSGVFIALFFTYLIYKPAPILVILTVIFGYSFAKLSASSFGGTTGDTLGASHEISRVLSLVVILCINAL